MHALSYAKYFNADTMEDMLACLPEKVKIYRHPNTELKISLVSRAGSNDLIFKLIDQANKDKRDKERHWG